MNNYNQSDTGLSIEVSVVYDNEQSQYNFNENFTNIVGDTWWYGTWDGIPTPTDFTDLFTLGDISFKLAEEILHEYNSDLSEYFDNTEDIVTELIGNHSFPDNLADFVEMLEDYDVPHTKLFERTISQGYSQGDEVEVFLPLTIRDSYGLADGIDLVQHCQQDIDSFLWDSPLIARCTINDEEFYSDTYDGQYLIYHYPVAERTKYNHLEWNKDTFIQEVLTNFPEVNQVLLKSELVGLVPDEPEYK